jgi:hypothetical protein
MILNVNLFIQPTPASTVDRILLRQGPVNLLMPPGQETAVYIPESDTSSRGKTITKPMTDCFPLGMGGSCGEHHDHTTFSPCVAMARM